MMAPDHTDSARVTDTQCASARSGCSCSRYNTYLWNLDDWRPDPACPRHGHQTLDWTYGDPTLDIDTSYGGEEE